jgi:hypothetical protein
MGVYGNFYLRRFMVAVVGLGANPPEDAIHPLCLFNADSKPLDGANRACRMRFAQGPLFHLIATGSLTSQQVRVVPQGELLRAGRLTGCGSGSFHLRSGFRRADDRARSTS